MGETMEASIKVAKECLDVFYENGTGFKDVAEIIEADRKALIAEAKKVVMDSFQNTYSWKDSLDLLTKIESCVDRGLDELLEGS